MVAKNFPLPQLAEVLGLEVDDINPMVGDTDTMGYTDVTGGSRVTFVTGMAAYEAGRDLQQQMKTLAADLWDCSADEITVGEDGSFIRGDKTIGFKELATELFGVVENISLDEQLFHRNAPPTVLVLRLQISKWIRRPKMFCDTRRFRMEKAIHPSYVEGQLQGGTVQGIGWALNEEYFYKADDTMANASFHYRMPTMLDVPMIDTIIVETGNPDHPYGVRGVGETPIVHRPPPWRTLFLMQPIHA